MRFYNTQRRSIFDQQMALGKTLNHNLSALFCIETISKVTLCIDHNYDLRTFLKCEHKIFLKAFQT